MTELFASSPFASALGQALVQFVWQGAAIAVVVAALLMMLRRFSPQVRYLVAVAGLAALTAAPVLTVSSRWHAAPDSVVIHLQLDRRDTATPAAVTTPPAPALPSTLTEWLEPRLPIIVMSWCAGVALLTLHLVGGWWRLTRIARRATPIVTGRLAVALPTIAGRIGVRRHVRLVESARVRMPSVVGWLRPVIVLPVSALAGLPPAHLEAILAHELAHIRRGDFAVNVLQCVVETFLFYHPAVWWVSRRIRVERELCCDDMAAALSPTRVAYARALTSLEELQPATRTVAVAANGGELLQRVRRILEPQEVSGSRWSGGVAMSVVLTVLLFTAGGHTLPASDLPLPAPVFTPAVAERPGPAPAVHVPVTPAPAPRRERPATAQPQTSTGAIAGTVRDSDGGMIPGATIIVTPVTRSERGGRGGGALSAAQSLLASSHAVTNTRGDYTIANLSPGLYELSVSLSGFQTARHTFTIAPGQTINSEIRLKVAALHESVTVRSPSSTQPASSRTPWPSTPTEYFDAARMYYEQGRLTEAEAMTTRALELLRRSISMSEVPPAPPPPAPGGPIRVGGSIRSPSRISAAAPVYPAAAAAAGIEGIVIIEAIIGTDGAVKNAKILRSVTGLDPAALDAVQQWRFTPTLLNGKPVEIIMTVDVTFTAK